MTRRRRRRRRSSRDGKAIAEEYYDPGAAGSLGGELRLRRALGTTKKRLNDWLAGQDTYTLHKPVRYRFPRRRVIVNAIDEQWQADLVDLISLSEFNDGFKYLLTVIDILSKFAWVVPLKDKKGSSLTEAFDSILTSSGRRPGRLQTDKGSEFLNSTFQKYLRDKGIHFFTSENEDLKASVVERFNRTLKSRMWRYFTHQRSRSRYINVLQDLVKSYNASYHRSIRTTPESVTSSNAHKIWHRLYDRGGRRESSPKFKIGDRVRISKARRVFKKGYMANWTEELFTVVRRLPDVYPYVYSLKDDAGDPIKGTFYEQELQVVRDKEVYLIDRVLAEKGNKVLVRWTGYPASFDSWIPRRDLVLNVMSR